MKAQILYGISNIKYVETDAPKIRDGEALIKISRCGICGSDIPRIYKTGAHNMPLIPGHEFTGTVVECKADENLEGKRVGVFPLIPCQKCEQCRSGHYEMCSNYNYLGSRCDGGFAEYVVAPVWNLLPIPDEVTDDEAAMLEPMCVAVHAIRRTGLISSGIAEEMNQKESEKKVPIVICGLGTIGLLTGMFLRDAGYQKILFIGNKNIQKQKCLEMGFLEDDYCDVRFQEPRSFVMDKTGGQGAKYYFECIGRPENYVQAVNSVSPLGTVMLVGNPASDMELPKEVYWKILRNQLTLKGTWNSSYGDVNDDWHYVISRLSAWKKSEGGVNTFSPSCLITHRFDLAHMEHGLDIMRRKSEEYIKIMVE